MVVNNFMHFKFRNRVHVQIAFFVLKMIPEYLLVSIQIVYIWLHCEKK